MRRVSSATEFLLGEVLARQSVSFRKHPLYPRLLARLPPLAAVRLDRKALAVLQRGRLLPENLPNLYRTYRLPADEFYPLFLRIQRDVREQRLLRKQRRSREIARIINALPVNIHDFIVFLAKLEGRYAAGCPVWRQNLYPKTKKRARELSSYTLAEWIVFFGWYLDLFRTRYSRLPDPGVLQPRFLLACMVLGCLPDPVSLRAPPAARVKACYRRLSKQTHPDAGGDPGLFRMISLARDTVLGYSAKSRSP